MEKDEKITSENEVVKEYQVPELVDLNGINETQAVLKCTNGSVNAASCFAGGAGPA
jgi:hypothetical protein